MTKKPPKHSERKKRVSSAQRMKGAWGAGRSAVPMVRIRPERILIVTEGTKTEPAYFDAFRRRINDSYYGEYVTVEVHGIGDNTISLFEYAQSQADADASGFTQVWVVYDKDDFPPQDFNVVADLCSTAGGDGIEYRAAWTNEAFELWFLLHFAYIDSGLSRKDYEPRLTSFLQENGLGAYRKNRTDMYEVLETRLDIAIANAERLEEANRGNNPAKCNPGTTVHHLVKELMSYLRVDREAAKGA